MEFFLILITILINAVYDVELTINRKAELVPSIPYTNEIGTHEIFFHQFSSILYDNSFFLTSISGNPIMYEYFTDNIKSLIISENQLHKFASQNFLINPLIIGDFSYSFVETSIMNRASSPSQEIIYCLLFECSKLFIYTPFL